MEVISAVLDTVPHGMPGPATATQYLTINFLELLASILLMFIAASFAVMGVKYFSTKKCEKVIPNSTDNKTIMVLDNRMSDGWWFVTQTFVLAVVLVLVRRAFGASFDFNFYAGQQGALTCIEVLIAFGVLAIAVPRWGSKMAERMAYGIVKSQLDEKKIPNVTREEYLALGDPEEVEAPKKTT